MKRLILVPTLLLFFIISAYSQPYDVIWTDLVGVSVNGNSLTSNAGTGWGNSGAASENILPAGVDGWVETTIIETNTHRMFGLSASNADADWDNIDYNFYLYNNGTVRIYEGSSQKSSNAGSYQAGDVARVERIGTTIYFKLNGFTIYTSTTPSNSSLLVDVSMYNNGSTLSNVETSFPAPSQGADTTPPSTPTNLSSSSTTSSSTFLSWTASTDNVGVTGYDIFMNSSLLATSTNTNYSVTGLSPSTSYSFYVRAKDAAGNTSGNSNTENVTTSAGSDNTPPTAPTGLTNSNTTSTSTLLSWTASTDNVGVTGYDVYMDGSFLSSTTSTSYPVSGLSAATSYNFYVRAKDAAGNVSSNSNTILVTTSSPSGCASTISSFPHSEGFENTPSWEPYTNVYSTNCTSGDNTFIRETGATTSGSTGPSSAQEGSYYVYAEGTGSACFNATYVINSPCYDLSGKSSADIDFYYHMWGSDMGTLDLEITTNGGSSWSSIWQLSGDQGDSWQAANVNLNAYVGQTIQLRFSSSIGSNYRSDMAVDNIVVDASGTPSGQPDLITQSISVPGSATEGASIPVSCQVYNQGNASAGSSTLYYYFSADGTYDGSDTYLGQDAVASLNASSASSESASLTIPTSLSAGTYYILFQADALGNVAESDENNNVGAQAITITTSGGSGGSNQWAGPDDLVGNIYHTGKVGIGISSFDTDNYLLYVNDGIKAEKVKVELPGGGWSDFVFAPNYQLWTLEQVDTYIKQNGHLPAIPSEKDLKEDKGFDLGNMVKLQQMKIEELTLYLIEMNQDLKTLKKQNEQLLKQLQAQKKQD